MRKLIVLPGNGGMALNGGIGGTTVTLSLMIQGFEECGASQQLCIVVRSGSEVEQYLAHNNQARYLHSIYAQSGNQFRRKMFQWVAQQPQNWPLLLDSWTSRFVLQSMALASPMLRLSRRPVYHFFHDSAYSERMMGNLVRKLIFSVLNPIALCNSRFIAQKVSPRLVGEIQDILYQPVDTQKFQIVKGITPELLKPILRSGAKIILTPSRISQPEQSNDKNLRGLITVLAHLKALGHHYHSVVIGRDHSANQQYTQALLEQAQTMGVADRFTVLPPTFSIKDYYDYADIVMTLAPREPFGRTVVEAIACGVPVIGSRTGGIGEILNHFAPEWTVDPFDSLAAATAIIQVANDPKTSKRLATGRHWVEEQCSPAHYAQKIIEITKLNATKLPQHQHNEPQAITI